MALFLAAFLQNQHLGVCSLEYKSLLKAKDGDNLIQNYFRPNFTLKEVMLSFIFCHALIIMSS